MVDDIIGKIKDEFGKIMVNRGKIYRFVGMDIELKWQDSMDPHDRLYHGMFGCFWRDNRQMSKYTSQTQLFNVTS